MTNVLIFLSLACSALLIIVVLWLLITFFCPVRPSGMPSRLPKLELERRLIDGLDPQP